MNNINGKYLISDYKGKTVVIRKEFNVPYYENGTSGKLNHFDIRDDAPYIGKEKDKYIDYPINFNKLKFLEEAYFEREASSVRRDGMIISLLNKVMPASQIHNKGEVSLYKDKRGNKIYEVNSLYRIEEFGDNFLQFKEFVMFSPSFLEKRNIKDILSTFIEKNIELFDKGINIGNTGISLDENLNKYKGENYWDDKLDDNYKISSNKDAKIKRNMYDNSGTSIFVENIFNLHNGKFYGIDNNLFLYYFIDTPNGKQLINPYILPTDKGTYEFQYTPTDYVYQYYNILDLITGLKSYKEKQWGDYLFGVNFHKFNGIEIIKKNDIIDESYNELNQFLEDESKKDDNFDNNSISSYKSTDTNDLLSKKDDGEYVIDLDSL